MRTVELDSLLAFNRWANQRILAALEQLKPEEFSRELGASFGSIRGTVLHLMGGERVWLRYWQTGVVTPAPPECDHPDVPSIKHTWELLDAELDKFVAELDERRLESPIPVDGQDFTLGELLQHVLNHSTYHRGQIALMIRQLGHTPPGTDYRLFLRESR